MFRWRRINRRNLNLLLAHTSFLFLRIKGMKSFCSRLRAGWWVCWDGVFYERVCGMLLLHAAHWMRLCWEMQRLVQSSCCIATVTTAIQPSESVMGWFVLRRVSRGSVKVCTSICVCCFAEICSSCRCITVELLFRSAVDKSIVLFTIWGTNSNDLVKSAVNH